MKTITTSKTHPKTGKPITSYKPTHFAVDATDQHERTETQLIGWALLAQTYRDMLHLNAFDTANYCADLQPFADGLKAQFAQGFVMAFMTPETMQDDVIEGAGAMTDQAVREAMPPKPLTQIKREPEYVPHVAPANWRENMLTITWKDIDALTHDEQTEVLAARGYSDQGTDTSEHMLASADYWLRLLLSVNKSTARTMTFIARNLFIHEQIEKTASKPKAKPTTKAKAK